MVNGRAEEMRLAQPDDGCRAAREGGDVFSYDFGTALYKLELFYRLSSTGTTPEVLHFLTGKEKGLSYFSSGNSVTLDFLRVSRRKIVAETHRIPSRKP